MNQENFQFEFKGFDPNRDVKALISNVAERLHHNAPSDSALKLALQSGRDAIRVSCRIVSRVGTFVAEAVGESPMRAVKKVEQKMRDQLDDWKALRFQSNANMPFQKVQ